MISLFWTYEYPLDSGCLWRSFHLDPSGGYDCTCEPALSVGFDPGGHPDIATNLTVNGRTATGTVWRVTTQTVGADHRAARESVMKERLTGLSNELRSETFEYRNGALALHTYSSFDPTNAILTEVSESATSGTTTTKSRYGVVIETTTSAGTTTNFFDPCGRVFYTEKDGRSVDWIGRNAYGDVEEYDTFHSEGNAYYAEFF